MIKNNIPKFISDIKEFAELISAEQPEIDRIEAEAEAWKDELSKPTELSFGIFEEFFGFQRREELSAEKRRERILARMFFSAPITRTRLEEQLSKVGGIPVEIEEDANLQTMTVRFTGTTGIPRFLEDIKAEMELIRPFHITPIYEYLFITLGEYSGKTLFQLSARTLEDCAESIS